MSLPLLLPHSNENRESKIEKPHHSTSYSLESFATHSTIFRQIQVFCYFSKSSPTPPSPSLYSGKFLFVTHSSPFFYSCEYVATHPSLCQGWPGFLDIQIVCHAFKPFATHYLMLLYSQALFHSSKCLATFKCLASLLLHIQVCCYTSKPFTAHWNSNSKNENRESGIEKRNSKIANRTSKLEIQNL